MGADNHDSRAPPGMRKKKKKKKNKSQNIRVKLKLGNVLLKALLNNNLLSYIHLLRDFGVDE